MPQVGHEPGVGAKLIAFLFPKDSRLSDSIIILSVGGDAFSNALITSAILLFSVGVSAMYARMNVATFVLMAHPFKNCHTHHILWVLMRWA